MQGALLTNSSGIILAHNHPSGNLKPSEQDIRLKREIKKAGEFLKIRVLDHLIITSITYTSLAAEGMKDIGLCQCCTYNKKAPEYQELMSSLVTAGGLEPPTL